ncbi:28319_t:CDS:2 [Dentiscutata erythropus]|uniref:28319_t:CDS:1 n=1 Tax=Dentiscutata erythropus TaxID=1348616 RepID=A0A9N9FQD9_9GLOM|nr:28319_t:CDS:2 [Dentiscutata erythropus]
MASVMLQQPKNEKLTENSDSKMTVPMTFLPENGSSNNSNNDSSNGEIISGREREASKTYQDYAYNTTPEKVQDHSLEKHKCTKPPTKNVL